MSTDPISKYSSHGVDYCVSVKHDTYPFISPVSPAGSLKGRYVLITGGSRGIGRATAISFARAGASGIAITARSALDEAAAEIAKAAQDAGHPAPIVVKAAGSVSSDADVAAASKQVSAAFGGKLDVVVLNAGSLETIRLMPDQNPAEWWASHESSVYGSFLCLHYFLPLLRQTSGGLGTVLATSSIGATAASPGFSGLQTAKLAQTRLMEFVNAEYGKGGEGFTEGSTPILAYSFHPGAILHPERTDLPERLMKMSIDTPMLSADTTVWLVKERREWLAGRWVNANWDMEEFLTKRPEIEKRDLLKIRLAMGGEDWSKA